VRNHRGEISATDSADCAGVIVDENAVPSPPRNIVQSSTARPFAPNGWRGRFVLATFCDDYKVEARKEGSSFSPANDHAASDPTNPLTLKHAEELHEQVQVTAVANQIDTQTPRSANRLPRAKFAIFPSRTRCLAGELTLCRKWCGIMPAACNRGRALRETQYLLDGFESAIR